MKYKTSKRVFNFQKLKKIRYFGNDILSDKITISEDDEKQSSLLSNNLEFNYKARPKLEREKKQIRKKVTLMKV